MGTPIFIWVTDFTDGSRILVNAARIGSIRPGVGGRAEIYFEEEVFDNIKETPEEIKAQVLAAYRIMNSQEVE